VDASSASDAASITATSQGQPVAAAVTVSTPLDTTSTTNGRASLLSIDGSGKARTKAGLPPAGDQDAPEPQSAKDGTSARSGSSAGNDKASTDSASTAPNGTSDAQSASSSATPQPPPATDSDPAGQVQTGTTAPVVPDRPATQAGALAASTDTAGSSGAPAGSATAKTNSDGVANFGISPANAATPTQVTATSGTVAPTAVPVAGLAVAIAARAKAGSNQFDIRLDPPELGRIDVRLDVAGNGQVTSHVTVDRADTLQLLQSHQPQLERALEQAGLKTADNGLQFTLRDQSFTGQNSNNGGAPAPAAQLIVPDADLPPIQSTQIYSRYGLGSGLDIRV
jgi:flagellar hook-length control protein FliK